MTGRAAKRSSHSIRTATSRRSVAPSMINKSTVSRLPKSTSWWISAAVDNSVCCGSPAVIQDSAEAARLGSGCQTDSDRMILWSG